VKTSYSLIFHIFRYFRLILILQEKKERKKQPKLTVTILKPLEKYANTNAK